MKSTGGPRVVTAKVEAELQAGPGSVELGTRPDLTSLGGDMGTEVRRKEGPSQRPGSLR